MWPTSRRSFLRQHKKITITKTARTKGGLKLTKITQKGRVREITLFKS